MTEGCSCWNRTRANDHDCPRHGVQGRTGEQAPDRTAGPHGRPQDATGGPGMTDDELREMDAVYDLGGES